MEPAAGSHARLRAFAPLRLKRDAGLLDWLAVFALFLGLSWAYGATLCPTVYWYDSAEFAARAAQLRAAHPPGYPTYIFFGKLFSQLGPEPAWGVNAMSAFFGAIAPGLLYVLLRQCAVAAPLAFAASLGLGLSPLFWANAVVAEVYTGGLTFSLATFVALLQAQARSNPRWLWVGSLIAGLGLGMHMSIATLGLGYALLVLCFDPDASTHRRLGLALQGLRDASRRRLIARSLLWVALGASVFLLMPLFEFKDLGSGAEWRRWGRVITGGAFKGFFKADLVSTAFAERAWRSFVAELGVDGTLLGIAGLALAFLRDRVLALALLLAALGNLWFFFDYQVHDIEVFFLPAIALCFAGVALGLDTLLALLTRAPQRARMQPWLALALGVIVALPCLSRAPKVAAAVDLSEAREAREYLDRVVAELPPGARFVKYNHHDEWKYYAVLLYAQEALGLRKDIQVSTFTKKAELRERLARGEALYIFNPVGTSRRRFRVKAEGPAHRILGLRR